MTSTSDALVCLVGCKSPVIGFATLKGKVGGSVEGHVGIYAICKNHFKDLTDGNWDNVEIIGCEPLKGV